jgi:phage terminase large subunit
MYRKGLSNKDIADVLINSDKALTVADSAEPKSIDEIISYGVSVIPSQKGQGSVLQGIQYVQDHKIFVTKRSTNIWHEQRNYLWLTDKEGKIINEPSPIFNHLMDAGRYAMESLRPVNIKDIELFGNDYRDINKGLNTKWRF